MGNTWVEVKPASVTDVAASVRRIRSMSLAEKESLCDDLFSRQRALLAHVLVLSKLDVPIQKVDRVLHILLVLYDLFSRTVPTGLPQVSEDLLEQVDANQLAMLKLIDSEEPAEADRVSRLATTSHPEINALAFATGDLIDFGITNMLEREDEYCVRAARNLVDAFAQAKRTAQQNVPHA